MASESFEDMNLSDSMRANFLAYFFSIVTIVLGVGSCCLAIEFLLEKHERSLLRKVSEG